MKLSDFLSPSQLKILIKINPIHSGAVDVLIVWNFPLKK